MVQGRCLVVEGRVLRGAAVCCVSRAVKGLYMQSGREAGEAYIELVTIVSLIVGAFTCCTLLVSK